MQNEVIGLSGGWATAAAILFLVVGLGLMAVGSKIIHDPSGGDPALGTIVVVTGFIILLCAASAEG